LGRGQGCFAAATAAGGRPPSPATAYRPNQTRPENLPWQRRTTHLIEIKYCENTRPGQQLQAAHAQHGHLRRSIAGDHVLHVILLGVGGVIYISHALVPLKSLGLDSQRVKKLAHKLHAHSVHNAHKLVQSKRFLEHFPHLQINQERFADLSVKKAAWRRSCQCTTTRGGSNAFSCGSSQGRPQQQLTPWQQQRSTGCAHAEAHCHTKQPGQPGHIPTAYSASQLWVWGGAGGACQGNRHPSQTWGKGAYSLSLPHPPPNRAPSKL